MRNPIRCLLNTAVALAILAVAPALYAQTATHFTLPAQSLADSLRAVGTQTNTSVVFDPSLVEGRRAPAIDAQMSLDQALSRLLAGSGLTHQFINERTVVLASAGAKKTADASHSGAIRLAQVDQSQEMEKVENTESPQSEKSPSSTSAEVEENKEQEPDQEVVVTGSQIRGVTDLAVPTTTVTRKEIEDRGWSSVEDMLRSIPQNYSSSSPAVSATPARNLANPVANSERAISVDLRGLGPQSTLSLLNGTRRASIGGVGRTIDVSSIPLSMVERVEVVTGGRSAVYGADAVAGVVNFVTRRQFEGVEAQGQYSGIGGGPDSMRFSLVTGSQGERGGIALGYDYSEAWSYDAVEAGLAQRSTVTGSTPQVLWLQPNSHRHSGMVSGEYQLTSKVRLYGDAMYSWRKLLDQGRSQNGANIFETFDDNRTEEYSVYGGVEMSLPYDWQVDIRAGSGLAQFDNTFRIIRNNSDFPSTANFSEFELNSITAVADGPLPELLGIRARSAVGAEYRKEQYEIGGSTLPGKGERSVKSIFAEVLLPLAKADSRIGEVDVSAAVRLDDYSDFGQTTNPQFGVIWRPIKALTLRGSYSKAFRAPSLFDGQNNTISANLSPLQNPSGGTRPVFIYSNTNGVNLKPERARTWTAGVVLEPLQDANLRLAVDWFKIDYRDRLSTPAGSDLARAIVLADRFPEQLNLTPSEQEIRTLLATVTPGRFFNGTPTPFDPATQSFLTTFPNIAIFNNSFTNIATEQVEGIDADISGSWESGQSRFNAGLRASLTLKHDRRVTATSPIVLLLDELNKPVNFRANASLGWTRKRLGANIFLNYVDTYKDPFFDPPRRITSWFTTDLSLHYSIPGGNNSFLSGLGLSFYIQNLFDRSAPRVPSTVNSLIYDSVNATPFGRSVSIKLRKRW